MKKGKNILDRFKTGVAKLPLNLYNNERHQDGFSENSFYSTDRNSRPSEKISEVCQTRLWRLQGWEIFMLESNFYNTVCQTHIPEKSQRYRSVSDVQKKKLLYYMGISATSVRNTLAYATIWGTNRYMQSLKLLVKIKNISNVEVFIMTLSHNIF